MLLLHLKIVSKCQVDNAVCVLNNSKEVKKMDLYLINSQNKQMITQHSENYSNFFYVKIYFQAHTGIDKAHTTSFQA